MSFPVLPNVFQLLHTYYVLLFISCDPAGLTLTCMCKVCPVYRLLSPCPLRTCLSAGQPLVVLTPLWEVTSNTREETAEPCDGAGSQSRLLQHHGTEGTSGMFPKSSQPKGPMGHSCAESTVTRGLSCDTSRAQSAMCS